jgi:hypothetical protein
MTPLEALYGNFQKYRFNRTDPKLVDLLCNKHNFCSEWLVMISTIQTRQHQDEQHIQIIVQSNSGRWRKWLATETIQKCIFLETFLMWYLSNRDLYRRSLMWQCTWYGGEQHIQISFQSNGERWSYSNRYELKSFRLFPCVTR